MTSKRVAYLDFYRYLTVSFAIMSHAIIAHHVTARVPQDIAIYIKALTRTATPSLIVLFGMMIEIVYVKKWRNDHRSTLGTLSYRIVLCYLAFVGLAAAEFLTGDVGLKRLISSAMLIAPNTNGNIFKLYIFLLALIPPIIFIRTRFGGVGLILSAVIAFTAHHFLIRPLPPLSAPFDHIGGLAIGLGNTFGPSVPHCLALIAFGMICGSVINTRAMTFDRGALAICLTMCLAIVGAQILNLGLNGVLLRVAEMRYWRSANHPGYFAFGCVSAITILSLSYALVRYLYLSKVTVIYKVGGSTLMYFFVANILIVIFSGVAVKNTTLLYATPFLYVVSSTFLCLVWVTYGKKVRPVVAFNRQVSNATMMLWNRDRSAHA